MLFWFSFLQLFDMKYFLIAGEASGDLHGANLMKGLKKADTSAEFRFFGGPLMEKEGGKLLKHYREMAFMGVFDVLKNLKTIRRNFRFCREQLLAFRPDVLILIDYPGFNLKMAEFAHRHGIRVFYYIAPKLWAWKAWRIKKVKAFVDEMFTIFRSKRSFLPATSIRCIMWGTLCWMRSAKPGKVSADGKIFFATTVLATSRW